jgi:hypothetical protein
LPLWFGLKRPSSLVYVLTVSLILIAAVVLASFVRFFVVHTATFAIQLQAWGTCWSMNSYVTGVSASPGTPLPPSGCGPQSWQYDARHVFVSARSTTMSNVGTLSNLTLIILRNGSRCAYDSGPVVSTVCDA